MMRFNLDRTPRIQRSSWSAHFLPHPRRAATHSRRRPLPCTPSDGHWALNPIPTHATRAEKDAVTREEGFLPRVKAWLRPATNRARSRRRKGDGEKSPPMGQRIRPKSRSYTCGEDHRCTWNSPPRLRGWPGLCQWRRCRFALPRRAPIRASDSP
jgi:hypothetical protein